MKKKSIVYLVIALLVVCCSSLVFAQALPKGAAAGERYPASMMTLLNR